LKVDKNGVSINGHITAQSLTITEDVVNESGLSGMLGLDSIS
jgi:hypothetical protein